MNKYAYTALMLFVSLVTFAQRSREGRFPASDGPEDQFATPGGNPQAPIDQYVFVLLAMAVLMIGYVVYRRIQLSKTV